MITTHILNNNLKHFQTNTKRATISNGSRTETAVLVLLTLWTKLSTKWSLNPKSHLFQSINCCNDAGFTEGAHFHSHFLHYAYRLQRLFEILQCNRSNSIRLHVQQILHFTNLSIRSGRRAIYRTHGCFFAQHFQIGSAVMGCEF